jgi:uncharacterized protein YjbI with pentapeptide repeats
MDKNDELARILDEHARWLASAEQKGARADLSGAQLDAIDLSDVDLSGARLRGVSLNGANLQRVQLTHADLVDASLQRADLSGANLLLADFTGADLNCANLRGTTSTSDKELGHVRRGPKFCEAILRGAQMQDCYCAMSDFSGSQLADVNLTGANLEGAKLSNNDLAGAGLRGANLATADLTNSDLSGADLREARLVNTDFAGADLSGADVSSADLQGANFADARAEGIRYDRKATYRGIRVASCYGSSRFRRFAQDQEYIEEFKEAYGLAYWIWLVLTDCGRSMVRVVLWSAGLTLLFALIYNGLGEQAFAVSNKATLGWSFFTAVYYSVVTFTTLGFGDITPLTPLSAIVVMIEVVVGYVMLGILISILATKVARRS